MIILLSSFDKSFDGPFVGILLVVVNLIITCEIREGHQRIGWIAGDNGGGNIHLTKIITFPDTHH